MSNRILERVTTAQSVPVGTTDVNITEQAGVDVAAPIGPGDNVPLPGQPFFSVGAVLYAWDGVQFQRLRVDGEKVLLTHEAYYRAGENPLPELPASTLSDALRTKRGETTRAVHLPRQTLPTLLDESVITYFTSQSPYPMLPGTARITYWVTYYPNPDPTVTDGQVLLVPYWGNGTDEHPDTACNPGDFPVTGQESLLTLYTTRFTTNPVGAIKDPVRLVVSLDVPAGATTCRLLAKEIGDANLGVGDVEIAITTSS